MTPETTPISPWWSPNRHNDRRGFLTARGQITRAVRAWFEAEGFTEVETGALVVSPGNETHLHAPRADLTGHDGEKRERYLRTSPEFACKKLLAAGETRIFELARVFRDRERGDRHLPEFTMLEWYRANEDYEVVIRDTVAIIQLATDLVGTQVFDFRGHRADTSLPPEFLTVFDAFSRFAGVNLAATVRQHEGDRKALADAAKTCVRVADDDTWSDIFSKILVEHVEPHLGQGRMTVLYQYPTPEAALARTKADNPNVAERFEVYACGGELTDADEQRRRFVESMEEKQRRYGERYPIDEEFLAAIANMPPASGVALGFDRLVMLAAGATRIDQVVWTPPA